MSNHAPSGETDDAIELTSEPQLPDAIQSTETYQTDEGTVFYDAQNPLAWLQTDAAVRLSDRA
ncbi:hypothetical protein SAMN05216559_2471 [Halomicrobium zhouii]|uniref:Uncharacterized protein n=1 Tax=Halomicrobium zhouii TaxID=767519 RepID=A0A1I6LDE4_9EURY|nr:hypothetical protein [Halomicrobium zhouii]MCU4800212.1 hypothetical protein [Halobacteria archaeon HArc-gm2]SFS01260.1 hypothetical protein SAMN05216559_2471 [Halomicrobium zhouii]